MRTEERTLSRMALRWITIGLVLASSAGCARHVVANRADGVVDGDAGTASYSDPAWVVSQEPDGDES